MADPIDVARVQLLKEPHGLYVAGDEYLRVFSLSAAAGAVLVTGRFLETDGRLTVIEARLALSNDRSTPSTIVRKLGAGWLLNLTAVLEAGALAHNAAFIRVDLVRGDTANAFVAATLLQGGVTDTQRRAWPGSPIVGSLEGSGVIRSITGADPAAGVEISETVPAGARWRLMSLRASLTTDASVANRRPVFTLDDGAAVYYSIGSSADIPASNTIPIIASQAASPSQSAAGHNTVPLPPGLVMSAGHRIRTVTTSFQAGDNWTAPQMLVEEWLEGA